MAEKLNKIETLLPDVNVDHHGGGLISSYSSSCSEIHAAGRLLPLRLVQDKSVFSALNQTPKWVPETNLFGNNYVAADNHVINYLKLNVYHGKTEKTGSSLALIKGQWTDEEDRKLSKLVKEYGVKKWAQIAEKMVGRAGKQCRERWHNHLRPDIKKDNWTEEEEFMLIEAHRQMGNKWAEIAKRIRGRTENSIKNHWNATKRRQNSRRKNKKTQSDDQQRQQSTLLQEYIWSIRPAKNDTSPSCVSASVSSSALVHSGSIMASYNTLTSKNNFGNISTYGYGDTAYGAINTTQFQPSMKICNEDCSTDKVTSPKLPITASTDPIVYPIISTSEDSTSYLTQTFDEEMNFMQNLFGNNSTKSSQHDTNQNPQAISSISSLGFSSPTRKMDFDFGTFFSSSSSASQANFQMNNCNREDKKCYLAQLFEGSSGGCEETYANDNSVSMETTNTSHARNDMDLIEVISSSQFSQRT